MGGRHDAVDLGWLCGLARVHRFSGYETALAQLAAADRDGALSRKKLVEMARKRHDGTAAARWARRDSRKIAVDTPTRTRPWGTALGELGQVTESIAPLETAVQLDPDQPRRRLALAEAYTQARRWADARRALGELLGRWPDDPGADLRRERLPNDAPQSPPGRSGPPKSDEPAPSGGAAARSAP